MQMLTVKGWRESMGMDLAEVAERIGLMPECYTAKENGVAVWTGDEILDLAEVFGISVVKISI